MARRAEQMHSKYPENKAIDKLITETFDGLYLTQEGGDFFIGFNRDLIGGYNQIVDLLNGLERNF